MGQHGEAGGGRSKILTADETAVRMIAPLIEATGVRSGDKAFLIINGVGSTTLMEMNLIYRKAHQVLEQNGIEVVPGLIDELLTVQEMGGFQMILCKLDADHAEYLKAPAKAPYWNV